MPHWKATLYDLICRTSTDLPEDVDQALARAMAAEDSESRAAATLTAMRRNAALARDCRRPLCQDTGTLLLWVEAPPELHRDEFETALREAVCQATAEGLLRDNCVDPLENRCVPDNWGPGNPVVHWNTAARRDVHVALVMKGGGCENVGRQYALPDPDLEADRDLEGVRTCLLDAVYQAQGRGCAPGVLAAVIGGDRATGYTESKRQFLRRLGQRSAQPRLAELEERVLREANTLGIGPMGVGGCTTLLDVFVTTLCRLPASWFVSVSYMCWAYRRRQLVAAVHGTLDTSCD